MSHFADLLRASHPDALPIPDELDAAWAWMEDHGHAIERDGRVSLTAYAGDRVLGIVFDAGLTIDGWFTDKTPDDKTLLPIAQADGTGSLVVLWNDRGTVRVGVLGSEGERFLLAKTPLDLLRAVAVGHQELSTTTSGRPPRESASAVDDFRAWVQETYDVKVPASFTVRTRGDAFSRWVDRLIEGAPKPKPTHPVKGTQLSAADLGGEGAPLLELVGRTDAREAAVELLGVTGVDPNHLRDHGIQVFTFGDGPQPALGVTVYLQGEGAYPRPDALFEGFGPASEADDVRGVLGEPSSGDQHSLFYAWGTEDEYRIQMSFRPGEGLRSVGLSESQFF
ncbi:hypothetical protein [Nocardioides lijunqiniae]|uniref:hypothetical protein n=1 Tax=Nocardioides lijunqiniae TaxID=2760832 RepID=UPI00187808E6|nr:hypothetical protein [Nocardioides lijunqiniae]